jgi:phage shock protein A
MTVEERLAAVERAVTDDEVEPAALSDAATVERRLDDLETQLDRYEDRLASVEAGVDAVRGHVGDERRSVDDVEQTAASALSTARRIQRQLDDGEGAELRRPPRTTPAFDPVPDGASDLDGDESDTRPGVLARLRRLVYRA